MCSHKQISRIFALLGRTTSFLLNAQCSATFVVEREPRFCSYYFHCTQKVKKFYLSQLLQTNIWTMTIYMWQSHVEIEGYSVAYFNRIAVFKVPYRWTSVKGEAHMHFVDLHASMEHVWAPPLTEVQWYGASNTAMRLKYAIEIRDGITFNFHTGLPHI